jgi:uncharacterized protein (TIGR01777 family)
MRVVVAGGSGALGRRLCDRLTDRGHDVVVLSRRAGSTTHRTALWDGRSVGAWADELQDSAVVNLAGELVDRRPTPRNVRLLTSSRVEPTQALARAAAGRSVPVWLQASTLAIHGDAGEQLITEESPPADRPPQMAGVAKAWEAAAVGAPAARQVVLRTSIVLDRDTPALDRLAGVVRWGLGGRVGSGRQWFSWVHVEDWLRLTVQLLEGEGAVGSLSGVVVATSPEPVRNAELMRAMRSVLRRPPAPPTPAWAVRLGSIVLRTDPALALTGRRAVPARLLQAGFEFERPRLEAALSDLLA